MGLKLGGCANYVSDSFKNYGFNQDMTDMIIIVTDSNYNIGYRGQGLTSVGVSNICFVNRRVTYGYIAFLTDNIENTPMKIHLAIQLTIHEMIHILGLNDAIFGNFYMSPTSNQKRPINQVIRRVGGQSYIVTPKVMRYIKDYFGCNDGVTGALLEEESKLGHWNRLVFRDELMVNLYWETGGRISRLTLALLEDTGFYASVDTSLSEPSLWGAGKGCLFAQGVQFPEALCQPATCDYYSKFGKDCNSASPVLRDNAFSNYICEDSSIFNPTDEFSYFGTSSRCFAIMTQQYILSIACLQSQCINGNIVIKVKNSIVNCTIPGQIFIISEVQIQCPTDFRIFCSYKDCNNWCGGKGFCLNGKCFTQSIKF